MFVNENVQVKQDSLTVKIDTVIRNENTSKKNTIFDLLPSAAIPEKKPEVKKDTLNLDEAIISFGKMVKDILVNFFTKQEGIVLDGPDKPKSKN